MHEVRVRKSRRRARAVLGQSAEGLRVQLEYVTSRVVDVFWSKRKVGMPRFDLPKRVPSKKGRYVCRELTLPPLIRSLAQNVPLRKGCRQRRQRDGAGDSARRGGSLLMRSMARFFSKKMRFET